jgi:hypothetical protein
MMLWPTASQLTDYLHHVLGLYFVSLDVETIGVDLASVPIDEILDFRRQHLGEYRRYAANIKTVHQMLARMPEADRAAVLAERQEEIKEQAAHLAALAPNAWRTAGGVGIGIAGAAWTMSAGDVLGGILTMASAFTLAGVDSPSQPTAYSYLIQAGQAFPNRARGRQLR